MHALPASSLYSYIHLEGLKLNFVEAAGCSTPTGLTGQDWVPVLPDQTMHPSRPANLTQIQFRPDLLNLPDDKKMKKIRDLF
jgi:hypothetical protein